MKRRRLVLAGAGAVVALAVLAAGAAALIAGKHARRASASAARTVTVNCPSPALAGRLPALVYLPHGYVGGTIRYPVVYFLHGLPAGRSAFQSNGFVASAVGAGGRPALVVAPQGVRSDGDDREYLDWGPKEDWPQAISQELTRCIDRRFRTIANRHGRALIGLSAGGYGAANIGLRNLATFAAVESWSGYFEATDPSGLHKLNLGSGATNALAEVPRGGALKARLRRLPMLIAFYVGLQDTRFLADNREFNQALNQIGIPHRFATYPGGHSGSLWHTEAAQWLSYALVVLTRAH
jgi:putative tributyrin esterase